MRTRMAFLSCTVVAMAALLAPTAATGSSLCSGYSWTVKVDSAPPDAAPGVKGACAVNDPANPTCVSQGAFTGIKYRITGSAKDAVATLVTRDNTVSGPGPNQVYAACDGEPVTGLGKSSCHEQAVRLKAFPTNQNQYFWVVVSGQKKPIETSVAVMKNHCVASFPVPGLGLEGPNPFQTTRKTETVTFKGCAVTFALDAVTGAVIDAFNDPANSSPAPGVTCSNLIVSDVQDLTLNLAGVGDLGAGKIGDGYISSGNNSCTTRIIGGRLYTWGSPCPDFD